MKSFGITNKKNHSNKIDLHLENLELKGYSIENNVLDKKECEKFISLLDEVYSIQENEFGHDKLKKVDELDVARMPLLYNTEFIQLMMNPLIIELVGKVLKNTFHLHLQNGIINKSKLDHHQISWHRDLPYQDWVISKPLALNAFYCLTDFTVDNGSTVVLPFSHKIDYFPSDNYIKENEVKVIAPAGSIIFFDSMIFHRASYNLSNSTRYGLNNMYVSTMIKQQVDIPKNLEKENLSDKEKEILGFNSQIPFDVLTLRENRYKKIDSNEK
jgi:ectoine hydroxylase-related dioxygenase (phytanoyl-CoA dioxygenase family)